MRFHPCLSAAVLITGFGLCQAQVPSPSNGLPNSTSLAGGPDVVNLGNLGVYWSIPLIQMPSRGTALKMSLNYDGLFWQRSQNSSYISSPACVGAACSSGTGFGWSFVGPGEAYKVNKPESDQICGGTARTGYQYVRSVSTILSDSAAAVHTFPNTFVNNECTGAQSQPTSVTDTTGQGWVYGNGTATDIHGNKPAQADTNGNALPAAWQVPGSNGGSNTYTDNAGGSVVVTGGPYPTYTSSGATQWTVNPAKLTYTAANGSSQTVTINYQLMTVQTHFQISGAGEYGPYSTPLPTSVSYPDGSAYTFAYEATPGYSGSVTGRLSSITLPTGGVISYNYLGGGDGANADMTGAGLTRTFDGSQTSYARSNYVLGSNNITIQSSTTTVTDPSSNQTVVDFVVSQPTAAVTGSVFTVPTIYRETRRRIYAGSSSGTLLRAVAVCYNGSSGDCTTTAISSQLISQVDTTTTLDNGQSSKNHKTFSYGSLLTESDDYDYGASSPTLETSIQYASLSNNILDRPSSVVTMDGSNNVLTRKTFGYDETTKCGLAPTSGLQGHSAVSGSRGNLTSSHEWANYANTNLDSYFCYDDAGQLVSSIDPGGFTTSFAHDGTDSFVTGTTLPTPSSGVGLSSASAYSAGSGVLASTTNLNGQQTIYKGYDALNRVTEIDNPDGGKTTTLYRNPNQTGRFVQRDGSHSTQTETLYDGYGRSSRFALSPSTGGSTWYQADTCYDTNGRVSFKAYKYQNTGFNVSKVCSGAGDSYSYDALGRVTLIKHGDGTQVSYQYSGRAVRVADENNVVRISQSDAFGRTTIVCEISAATLQGDAPTGCGTDIAGTGFVTGYRYDQPDHAVFITQGVQTRVFQTDSLGRPWSSSEPERGGTTYRYTYNGTGLQVTRTRPSANQTNTSATTTTTTQYDSLSRPVQTTYSDGTPVRYYNYDQDPAGTNANQTNPKGRLVKAYSIAAGNQYDTYFFGYDAMGRIIYTGQCFPYTCGNPNAGKSSTATYDWEGNLTSTSDPTNATVSYTYTDANELTSLTRSISNANSPGQIVSNVQNGPYGPVSYSQGNGTTEYLTYDGLGRPSGKWLCKGGTPGVSCPNGTQLYGTAPNWSGDRMVQDCDTVINSCRTYGYDEFDRLVAATTTQGAAQNLNWSYDRYGNRWSQGVTAGSGPQPSATYDKTTNRISSSGYAYDAAGNLLSDSLHRYTYDAEGNVTAVDGGQTAVYTYDALNRRFRVKNAQNTVDYQFDVAGRRAVVWQESSDFGIRGMMYWGGGTQPAAFNALDGTVYFQQGDWLGTERVRANSAGNVAATYFSLPFGDGFAASGSDEDPDHLASTERDKESSTDHAQFRQYSEATGRWMSPDPYDGSYDLNNPESLNRYSYAANKPLSFADPSGLLFEGPNSWTGSNSFNGGSPDCTLDGAATDCGSLRLQARNGSILCASCLNSVPNSSGFTFASNGDVFAKIYGFSVDSGVNVQAGIGEVDLGSAESINGLSGDRIASLYRSILNPDSERIRQLAIGINRQAGWIGTPQGVAGFYAVSLSLAAFPNYAAISENGNSSLIGLEVSTGLPIAAKLSTVLYGAAVGAKGYLGAAAALASRVYDNYQKGLLGYCYLRCQ